MVKSNIYLITGGKHLLEKKDELIKDSDVFFL